ncbi:MAG: toprim domain-containing protein, partial [Acidimicrobiia bacterium]|nr:toprim domain-containing protein [Acidimicrobiia bacterium]
MSISSIPRDSTVAFDRVMEAIRRRGIGIASESEHSAEVHCPVHDDGTASLSIRRGDTQPVVLCCGAGCDRDSILTALGLSWPDLCHPLPPRSEPRVFAYHDTDGSLLAEKVHKATGRYWRRPEGEGYAIGLDGMKPPLYRLPSVLAALDVGATVWIVEGESDADAIAALGEVATTPPHGAGSWEERYTDLLQKAHQVIVCRDRDDAGRQHAAEVVASLRDRGVLVELREPAKGKDVRDHLDAGLGLDDLAPVDEDQDLDSEVVSRIKPVDFDALLEDVDRIAPTIFPRWDGQCLLYPRRVNLFFGESESGKSMAAIAACCAEVLQGHHVIYLDWEDDEYLMLGRLRDMGVDLKTITEFVHYFALDDGLTATDVLPYVDRWSPSLVVVDAVTEAMVANDLGTLVADDVARFLS